MALTAQQKEKLKQALLSEEVTEFINTPVAENAIGVKVNGQVGTVDNVSDLKDLKAAQNVGSIEIFNKSGRPTKLKEEEMAHLEEVVRDAHSITKDVMKQLKTMEHKDMMTAIKVMEKMLDKLKHEAPAKKSLNEGKEPDYEGQMAKVELYNIVKNARDLYNVLHDDTQLKAWVQSKITKANEFITAARQYVEGENIATTAPVMRGEEPVKDSDDGSIINIGDVVKAGDGKLYQIVHSFKENKAFLTPFDIKRKKPIDLADRHYMDENEELCSKMSRVMDHRGTKGYIMP